jgi:glucose-6-phosphate isomerase
METGGVPLVSSIFSTPIQECCVHAEWSAGLLTGAGVQTSVQRIANLTSIFKDKTASLSMDSNMPVYEVQLWQPLLPGSEGGLFVGVTKIFPGKVGAEYFMTRGHFHAKRNRGEFYTVASGAGVLILMDEGRKVRCETMTPGSIHYIPGCTAHRVANTGDSPLIFWAHWPSDAGHDYETIREEGFSARLMEAEGKPFLITEPAISISPDCQGKP